MSNAMEIGTTLYRARSSLFIGYMDHGNVRVDIYSFVVTAITRSGYWLAAVRAPYARGRRPCS